MNLKESDNDFLTIFPRTAAVLIDGSYWHNIRQELGAIDVDLVKLSDDICKPAYRVRSYYFDGKDNTRQSFHDGLRILPRFEVQLGDVVTRQSKCPHCQSIIETREQKRVDVQLAVQMVHLATSRQVDLIVIIAGDRDFIPSIEIAKHSGTIVRLVHGAKNTTATDLRQLADETIELTNQYLRQFVRERTKKNKRDRTAILSKKNHEPEINVKQLDNLLIRALSEVKILQNNKVLASQLGIALSKIQPDWKKRYKGKKVKDLVKLSEKRLLVPKMNDNVLYFEVSKDYVNHTSTNENESKSSVEYILKNLKNILELNQKDMIPLSVFGLYLAKTNKNWKEEYKIKKLSDLIKKNKEYFKVKTQGTVITIGIAKK